MVVAPACKICKELHIPSESQFSWEKQTQQSHKTLCRYTCVQPHFLRPKTGFPNSLLQPSTFTHPQHLPRKEASSEEAQTHLHLDAHVIQLNVPRGLRPPREVHRTFTDLEVGPGTTPILTEHNTTKTNRPVIFSHLIQHLQEKRQSLSGTGQWSCLHMPSLVNPRQIYKALSMCLKFCP